MDMTGKKLVSLPLGVPRWTELSVVGVEPVGITGTGICITRIHGESGNVSILPRPRPSKFQNEVPRNIYLKHSVLCLRVSKLTAVDMCVSQRSRGI